ncbi:hypothetical protein ACIA5C_48275 [Actinoplanes sp. NPDC051343]|uniref:hypothetical protein n=1 Tax=Actinoplanes sp. NPDC051343 TaxID=3363906 RepID=UPI0037A1C5E4
MITRSLATFAVVLLGGVATVLGGAAPAQAQPNDGCYHYTFVSSGLELGVDPAQASQPGASLVQLDIFRGQGLVGVGGDRPVPVR